MTTPALEATDGTGTLVILLHGYTCSVQSLQPLLQAAQSRWPNAKYLCSDLKLSLWSTVNPNDIVANLLEAIDAEVEGAKSQRSPISNIVLIGHSLGALLARKLYVVACGETAEAPFESSFAECGEHTSDGRLKARPWAKNISRLILLAGMNRGWRITHHQSLSRAPLWAIGAAVGHFIRLVSNRTLVISTIRQGAEFITQLRIQWLRMRQRHGQGDTGLPGGATTIQLLGSQDDMVAPEDNIDLVSGGDFVYLDVPYSGHASVIELNHPDYGPRRTAVFLLALTGSVDEMGRIAVVPSDERFASPDVNVKRMVFVIHGIRDVGYWTHKIARRIKQRAKDSVSEWATETSSYGYFPMLPFLFPWYRRQKVEWLMDQYTEALARYPNASFSYVGHSNGTYLLAKALELYPCCAFDHVVFAGSVIRSSYDWRRFINARPRRIAAVLNFVATSDWVVAFFPKCFELLKFQDLGGAGHDGFSVTRADPKIHQVTYVRGGHGAAIEEPVWDTIADFILTGKVEINALQPPVLQGKKSRWIELLGRFPPLVWSLIAVAAWGVWLGVEWVISAMSANATSQAFAKGFSLATYFLMLWLVVTRV